MAQGVGKLRFESSTMVGDNISWKAVILEDEISEQCCSSSRVNSGDRVECAILVRRSTITIIVSKLLDSGSPTMKSIDT